MCYTNNMKKQTAYLTLFLMAIGNILGGYLIWVSTGSIYFAIVLGVTVGWLYVCVKLSVFILKLLL